MEFLRQIEANRMATDIAMASLAEAGVIEPWPLEVEVDGKKTAIKDLHRINESAMGQLDDDAFLKLRKTAALAARLCATDVHGTDRSLRSVDEAATTTRTDTEDQAGRTVPNGADRPDPVRLTSAAVRPRRPQHRPQGQLPMSQILIDGIATSPSRTASSASTAWRPARTTSSVHRARC